MLKIVISGPAGSGKRALSSEIVRHLESLGMEVAVMTDPQLGPDYIPPPSDVLNGRMVLMTLPVQRSRLTPLSYAERRGLTKHEIPRFVNLMLEKPIPPDADTMTIAGDFINTIIDSRKAQKENT